MDKSKHNNVQSNYHGVVTIMTETSVADIKGKVPNEMVKMDITTFKAKKSLKVITIEKPNLWMIIDMFTGLKWSHLYVTKNVMIEPTFELFQKCKDINIPVKIVISDNAVKNKKLEQPCSSAY